MHVIVYFTVKLFLDTGEVSDRKRYDRPRVVLMPQVINTVRSEINQNPVKNTCYIIVKI